MHHVISALLLLTLSASAALQQPAPLAKTPPSPPNIPPVTLAPKTVFFDDQTGAQAAGKETLSQLKKWGRFQIGADKSQADLILVLSPSPPKGGRILYSGG